jgi:quinohemoprotein ethanol dehydrogenase
LAQALQPAKSQPAAQAETDSWPSFGRTGDEQHYSLLADINTGNVSKLGLAWHFQLPPDNTMTGPVEADGKLFITTGHSDIRAFDAVTGKQLWEYLYQPPASAMLTMRFGWGPKGLAYWNRRVFIATQDGQVMALDANDGHVLWHVQDFNPKEMRYINGPPRVFDGKVIIGQGGADVSPIRGYVTAYDAMTGKQVWRFYTVPGNPANGFEQPVMAMAAKTWKGDWWVHGGGGTAWNAFSYDSKLNIIYIGVGNGYPYNQALRSPGGGDNLFLASIVAVNADTGKYIWHYQTCPGEQWDCVAVEDMTLATIKIHGKERRVLMQAPKNGFFYVLDAATGEFISGTQFADKVTWAYGIDPKTGRPIENPGIRYHGKPGMFEMWPGPRGAHSWPPQSYSPLTGLVYIPDIEGGGFIGDSGIDLAKVPAIGGLGVNADPDPHLPEAWRSFLKAWDPVAGKARWSVELPGNWPGGTMATAGNLVFEGRMDGNFAAYDARTGTEVWSFPTGTAVAAPPISYSVDGKQYVTVLTGSGASGGGIFSQGNATLPTDYRLPRYVLTFVLNGTDKLPPVTVPPLKAPDDPTYVANPQLAAEGVILFGTQSCALCHGINAIGGGSAPDLRGSFFPTSAAAFKSVVKNGALLKAGMPIFPELTDNELEAIRQYLRSRQHDLASGKQQPSTAGGASAPGMVTGGY